MSDVVLDWARDQRAFFEAKELWKQAAKALPKLDAALPVETRQLVFDRFLAENPAALYAAMPNLHAAHWPLLKDALARSNDVEARLLLDAPVSARAELADFVAAITGATFGVVAVRTAGKPRLELDTDAFSLETVEAWLRALDPKAVSRVEVTLSSHGSFRKPERVDAEQRMTRLLSRFAEHAVHSKHPTR